MPTSATNRNMRLCFGIGAGWGSSAAHSPSNLLNRPGVQHYSLADLGNGLAMTDTAGPVTTFLTLNSQHNPIQGRYVRVQLAGAGALSLAEVQVFGANHINPDRYPLDLRD